jgi:hypothetical protein
VIKGNLNKCARMPPRSIGQISGRTRQSLRDLWILHFLLCTTMNHPQAVWY